MMADIAANEYLEYGEIHMRILMMTMILMIIMVIMVIMNMLKTK